MNYLSTVDVPPKTLYNEYRVTIGMVLIKDRRSILLVEPTKGSGVELILPQGGIDQGETFKAAFHRLLRTELPGATLLPGAFPALGQYPNMLPSERGKLNKYIFWFGAFIDTLPTRVNEAENRSFCMIRRNDELQYALSGVREQKRTMTLRVIEEARQLRMLAWPSSLLKAA